MATRTTLWSGTQLGAPRASASRTGRRASLPMSQRAEQRMAPSARGVPALWCSKPGQPTMPAPRLAP
eukprot:10163677-Alexandrium_andersonii.AAC.1